MRNEHNFETRIQATPPVCKVNFGKLVFKFASI